ncbi:MAG: dihydroorotase [Phycisphaerae bacterium]
MKNDQLLITNGVILDPQRKKPEKLEVLINEGKIQAVGAGLQAAAPQAAVLDANGWYVAPGLIDMHVHLREPGQEHKETIASGSAAAVAGGFTTICCMANTTPALDTDAQIEFVFTQAARTALCRVLPFGAITKGREGKELAELRLMHEAGAVGFSDDGCGVASAAVMLKALQYVKMFDGFISQHCEEPTLSGGSMNAGATATRLGLGGLSAVAEELMIARDLLVNKRIGARYHVQHISTAGSVELIRRAKAEGQNITAEVTPHHLLLNDTSCANYDTNYKMNPPLRAQADVQACLQAVVDGTIDCLATDHAPHAREEKELEFDRAPFGIVGLETALPLYVEALVKPGLISWLELIRKLTARPAEILRLADRGTLTAGALGDLVIINPEENWTFDPEKSCSKSRNTPFAGRSLTGRVTHTIVGGRIVYRHKGEAS